MRYWLVLLALIPILGTEYVYRFHGNTLLRKKTEMDRLAASLETLVVGSSSTHFGIGPAQIGPRAYNLGFVSQDLPEDVTLTERYLGGMAHLKRVVLGVTYHTPYYEIQNGPEAWREYAYFHVYGTAPLRFANWFDMRMLSAYYFREKKGPPLGEVLRNMVKAPGSVLPQALLREGMYLDEDGSGVNVEPDASQRTPLAESARAALIRHETIISKGLAQGVYRRNLGRLRPLLQSLADKNIKAYLVLLPVSREYWQGERPEQRETVRRFAREACAGLAECRPLDFEAAYLDRPGLFHDGDHLNREGKETFSRLLAERIHGAESSQWPEREIASSPSPN